MKTPLRFRQIHLDFHTSGAIEGIGEHFDKQRYQETLKKAAVDSITTFATCHHGWSYYDTKIGKRHPGLKFDLLRAQFDACKEIDVNVPIYLTAGIHNMAADAHPEWRQIDPDGRQGGWANSNLKAGFKSLSFHSPYLDYLCDQVREVVRLFPEANGIFLDIINQIEDCSVWALQHMKERGLDPLKQEDRLQSRMDALMKYYQRVTAAVRDIDPNMPVFHNSGHITPGYREILPHFSHLELESLPTGGWGYDHFPMSAKYVHKLDMEYLGMTGKFHSTWGEFGGFKHPNALRYECCAMLAYGAKCSVGDQLHPCGELDRSTYEIIGEAYREVAEKESYVSGASNIADIALLSSASTDGEGFFRHSKRDCASDTGAVRVLLEEHFLFDVIDTEMDLSAYKLLILPDDVTVDGAMRAKINAFLEAGGKLFLTGESGIDATRGMLFDIGAEVGPQSEFKPDYILPTKDLRPVFISSPFVMYQSSRRLKVVDGESLGDIHDPYFNRTWDHFCSHQHAPAKRDTSGYACGSKKGNITYLAHPVFSIYASYGQVALRQYIGKAIRHLLGKDESLHLDNFPSTARVTLTEQAKEKRQVIHLLHAHTINRGGEVELSGGNLTASQKSYEVIEELLPIHDIAIQLRCEQEVANVQLAPEGSPVDFEYSDGLLQLKVPEMRHHRMLAIEYSR
ncbi:alpha-amylase family protein [Coraliomargarita parva]|uniref:alpha-amylase family protein n=1 Tax=Coraliomargarita parva TaxID=3014050 RepID=UPI0022B5ACD0|nr:alpha-amylase family protein [Coraliomargarita parva]